MNTLDKTNEELHEQKEYLNLSSECIVKEVIDYDDSSTSTNFEYESYLNFQLKIEKVETSNKFNKCNICESIFIHREALEIHQRTHIEDDDSSSSSSSSDQNMEETSRSSNGYVKKLDDVPRLKPYTCTQCDRSFTTNSNLKVHLRTHTGERPYKCTYCDQSFSQSSALKGHIRIHTGEKPFKCDICEQSFTQSHSLKLHQKSHIIDKPYKCDQCDQAFSQLDSLKVHAHIHVVERPVFQFSFFNSHFDSDDIADVVENHFNPPPAEVIEQPSPIEIPIIPPPSPIVTTVTTSTIVTSTPQQKEKPFKCNMCDKRCVTKANLKIHVRTHTGEKPYVCNTCGKSFSQSSSLKAHGASHTGDKPFKCRYCDHTSARKQWLQVHERIHTGEKPFKCDVCQKAFAQSSTLNLHKRIHVRDKNYSPVVSQKPSITTDLELEKRKQLALELGLNDGVSFMNFS